MRPCRPLGSANGIRTPGSIDFEWRIWWCPPPRSIFFLILCGRRPVRKYWNCHCERTLLWYIDLFFRLKFNVKKAIDFPLSFQGLFWYSDQEISFPFPCRHIYQWVRGDGESMQHAALMDYIPLILWGFYRPQRSCEGYAFTGVCLSTGGGGRVPDQVYPPRSRHTPLPRNRHPPPLGADPPWEQTPPGPVHPPGPGTPPRLGTPPDQVHPPGADPPGARYTPLGPGTPPPPEIQPLLRTVRILLECILVGKCCQYVGLVLSASGEGDPGFRVGWQPSGMGGGGANIQFYPIFQ